jgi:hypothetical protein
MEPTDRAFSPDELGPLEYSPNDGYDAKLQAAREAFPDWDIYHAGHGYLAVPGDTVVYMALNVDTLLLKIRAVEGT